MGVSKRIQVLLKPLLTHAVEELAETQGENLSRMTAILVEEALTARGLNPKHQTHLPPDLADAMHREVAAVDRGWKPKDGEEAHNAPTPEWADGLPDGVSVERGNTNKSDEAQLIKLKLMQELME